MTELPAVQVPPAPAPAPNLVETALTAGWTAFKSRPWLLTVPMVILLPLANLVVLGAFFAITVAEPASEALGITSGAAMLAAGVVAIGLFGLVVLAFAIVGTGYAVTALRVVRGETPGAGDVLRGLSRAPGIVLASLVTVGAMVAVVGAGAIAAAVAASLAAADSQAASGATLSGALTGGLAYLVGVVVVILGIVGLYHVLAGLSQWPFLLLDGGLGAREAVAASWRMMRGRRLALLNLWFAVAALNVVGLLLLGFGAIFTGAIGVAAFASFHHGLAVGEDVMDAVAVGRPRRTPLAAWAVDAQIALRIAALLTLGAMIATIAPLIAFNRTEWSPYGPAWLLIGMTPLVLVPIVYFVAGWALGGTPGQRIVGLGWGRFRWLAAIFGLAVLVEVGALASIAYRATGGILALAVGYETARQLVAGIPEGFASAPNNSSASDRLDLPATDPDEPVMLASYRITDTAGTPYFFALRRYFRVETAEAAMTRLREPGASPTPALGEEAFTVRDENAGVVRMMVRAGDTVIAGEAVPEHAAALGRLLALQLERLDAARASVDRVYRWLPMPEERLAAAAASSSTRSEPGPPGPHDPPRRPATEADARPGAAPITAPTAAPAPPGPPVARSEAAAP